MINILVAEDDKHARKLLETLLKREGYTVFTAEDGEKVLEILSIQHIDLIILDIMMPKMDGFEVARLLREANFTMPILMATAKHLPEDKKKGFIVGTDDYMTKPIDTEEMLLRIRALLRRSQIVNERKLTIGKVRLDYDALTVTRENEIQTLPQKEFYLLYKLLSTPDTIFKRQELIEEIWGLENDSDFRTVDVHIKRIREKLEEINEFEIVTIRGIGYKAIINKE